MFHLIPLQVQYQKFPYEIKCWIYLIYQTLNLYLPNFFVALAACIFKNVVQALFKYDDHNLVANIGRPGSNHSLLHPPVLLGRVVLARLARWPARGPAGWSGGWSWSTYGRLAGSSPPVGWSCDVRKESCISSHRVIPAARRTWGQNNDQTQKEQKLYHLNMFQISFVGLRKVRQFTLTQQKLDAYCRTWLLNW